MRRARWLRSASFLGLLWLGSSQVGADEPPPRDDALRAELLRRVDEDQAARKALIGGRPSDPAALKAIEAIDRRNTAWLKGVVDARGWPGKSLVADDGAHAAWLLVQHADRDREFQRRCLGLLREAQQKGEATGQDLAYLTDRLLVADGKKQLYGTQFRRLGDGPMEPNPIEDEANVDRRRKEVGLMPMAEYTAFVRSMYDAKKEPRPTR
jgi:hypothetical protein